MEINNEIIPFSYHYIFNKKGKYNIKYSFKNKIKNIINIFSECDLLTDIDLSNFNSQNVTDMSYMLYRRNSLTNINLSDSILKILQI